MLDNKKCYQGQYIYIRITKLSIDKYFINVVDHMLLVGLIFVNQHHTDRGIRGSEVNDEITSIVKKI